MKVEASATAATPPLEVMYAARVREERTEEARHRRRHGPGSRLHSLLEAHEHMRLGEPSTPVVADPLLRRRIFRWLARLSATDRHLVCALADGSTVEEIAEDMGVPAGRLRVRLHRIRQAWAGFFAGVVVFGTTQLGGRSLLIDCWPLAPRWCTQFAAALAILFALTALAQLTISFPARDGTASMSMSRAMRWLGRQLSLGLTCIWERRVPLIAIAVLVGCATLYRFVPGALSVLSLLLSATLALCFSRDREAREQRHAALMSDLQQQIARSSDLGGRTTTTTVRARTGRATSQLHVRFDLTLPKSVEVDDGFSVNMGPSPSSRRVLLGTCMSSIRRFSPSSYAFKSTCTNRLQWLTPGESNHPYGSLRGAIALLQELSPASPYRGAQPRRNG